MKTISINTLKHKQGKQKLFMTMDIETILKDKFQVPVAISLAYFDKKGSIKNKVVVIDPNLLYKNEDIALKDLWARFFDSLISSLTSRLNLEDGLNPKTPNTKGQKSNKRNINSKIKIITPHLDSQSVERKEECMYIFMHNLGKFDGIYLMKGLLKIIHYNKVKTIINKENEFIEISAKIDKFKLIWKDSFRIFNVSLKELCEIFNTNTKKLHPYKSEYNNMNLFNNPLLLDEFKQYSKQDSIALLEALKTAQDLYYHLHSIDITSIWSASTLAMKIFRLKYLKKSIPTLNKYLDYFIRESYFGGITDVYKLYGENIFYYDVNSLYPHAMLNPMPSKMIKYYDSMEEIEFSTFFGFCTAIIKVPRNIKMPLLPFRLENGNVIYPKGQWTGTYFSEELKTVQKYGYKVIPLQGYSFEKEYYFNDYVNYFYSLKKKAKGPLRFIIKGLLNNLYGYFGRSLDLMKTVNVNSDEMKEYLIYKLIHNIIPIDEKTGIYLLLISDELKQNSLKKLNLKLIQPGYPTIVNTIEKKINRSFLDPIKIPNLPYFKSFFSDLQNDINNKSNNKINEGDGLRNTINKLSDPLGKVKANVAIASAVTSYARINMINLKMKLIQMDYEIYYSDTDSLFIDKPLPESFINSDLGGLKDELNGMVINKAYFLGPKKYGYQIKLPDGSFIDRSIFAGITRHSLIFDEIEKLAKGESLNKTKLIQFNRDLKQFKIQIKENIPVHLKKSMNKEIIDNNYITPSINQSLISTGNVYKFKKLDRKGKARKHLIHPFLNQIKKIISKYK